MPNYLLFYIIDSFYLNVCNGLLYVFLFPQHVSEYWLHNMILIWCVCVGGGGGVIQLKSSCFFSIKNNFLQYKHIITVLNIVPNVKVFLSRLQFF